MNLFRQIACVKCGEQFPRDQEILIAKHIKECNGGMKNETRRFK